MAVFVLQIAVMKTPKQENWGAYRPQGRIAFLKGPSSTKNLIEHLSLELPNTSLEQLKFLIALGAVYVNRSRILDADFKLHQEDELRVHLEPKRYPYNKEELLKRIVYECEDFVIFNKPSGIPMHSTLDNAQENLTACFTPRLLVTNRLDVPTSGLVLLAKNKIFQAYYNQLLTDRKVKKTYQALTLNEPALGLHKHFMIVSEKAPKKLLTQEEFESQQLKCEECLLEIIKTEAFEFDIGKKIEIKAPGFLSTVNLITGRTHQIRAQLSKLNCPIVGDEMYGGITAPIFGLHCSGLEFENFKWGLPFAK